MNEPEPTSEPKTVAEDPNPPVTIWAPDKEKDPEQHATMLALVEHIPAILAILRPYGVEEVHIVPGNPKNDPELSGLDFCVHFNISADFDDDAKRNVIGKLYEITQKNPWLGHLDRKEYFFACLFCWGIKPLEV